MKLFLTLLLVALALCCYQAEAKITCPALAEEMTLFVMGTEKAYEQEISTYGASPEVVADKMKLKKCVDKMSLSKRLLIEATLTKILAKCLKTC